jgi:HEXXH motif-containing protein
LVTGRQRVHLSGTAGGGWFVLPVVRATHRDRETVLRFDNLDPQNGPSSSAIPDGATAARWQSRVAPGWRLLMDRHREVADEFIEAISVLAPLPDPAAGTVSATARHAFGAIAMSTPTSPRSVAVTLAHELQHAKLSAVMDLLPLVEAGPAGRFYTPWRTDPRPFVGVLHGVYAHLAIADFWRRELTGPHGAAGLLTAEVEYVRWRDAVSGTATRLLGTDRLTDLGRRLVTIVLDTVGGWREEVSARASAEANRASQRHRAQWEKMHGRVP